MSDYIIKDTGSKGKGLYSTVNIPANHVILQFNGKLIQRKDITDFLGNVAACYLQIGPELYLDIGGQYSFFINHDCNSNCCVRIAANKAFLVSLRDIHIGDELHYDYSTTSTESADTWVMNCNCSQFYCRKQITGFSSLPKDLQTKYINNNIAPNYVIK